MTFTDKEYEILLDALYNYDDLLKIDEADSEPWPYDYTREDALDLAEKLHNMKRDQNGI